MPVRPKATTSTSVWRMEGAETRPAQDALATEEPLEIRVGTGTGRRPAAVTMRTPGADFELAAGFLFAEGVIGHKDHIRRISYCLDPRVDTDQRYNVVTVELAADTAVDLAPLERHFSMTSACGVCGKATLDGLRRRGLAPAPPGPVLTPEVLASLPGSLRRAQRLFGATGGLHAAALFTPAGELVAVREDVGRHNAMDKLVGWALLGGRIPLGDHLVLVSGRSSFELVQKALSAGVPVLCSVSAPSSLAVELARQSDMTLIGFLREGKWNAYSGMERLQGQHRA
jgi:FdhD protein